MRLSRQLNALKKQRYQYIGKKKYHTKKAQMMANMKTWGKF
jgi:hypothetical protein